MLSSLVSYHDDQKLLYYVCVNFLLTNEQKLVLRTKNVEVPNSSKQVTIQCLFRTHVSYCSANTQQADLFAPHCVNLSYTFGLRECDQYFGKWLHAYSFLDILVRRITRNVQRIPDVVRHWQNSDVVVRRGMVIDPLL